MKRILSLIIVVILLFSVCSCKSKPETDEVGQIITENETSSTETDIEKENTETTEQTDKTPEPEPEQTDTDNEETNTLTLDNVFSPYEVVITLTVEESKKGLTYTPEDFPEIDCYYIYPYNYYPEEYRPEYKDNYTIALMLNNPSKENVLKYVEIAKKDPRVHSACPNALEPSGNTLIVCIDEREEKYTKEDFKEYDVGNVLDSYTISRLNHTHCYDIEGTRRIQLSYKQDRKQIITKLASDPRIHYVMPHFPWFNEEILSIGITEEAQKAKEEYTAADFGIEDIATLEKPYPSMIPKGYHVVLNKPSKQTIIDLEKTLKQDPRIEYVELDLIAVAHY